MLPSGRGSPAAQVVLAMDRHRIANAIRDKLDKSYLQWCICGIVLSAKWSAGQSTNPGTPPG